MQDLKQLAKIIAERRKIPFEQALKELSDITKGKSKFMANIAISAYLDKDKGSSTTLPGIEDLDPIHHIKE